jgi:hypothetical protein
MICPGCDRYLCWTGRDGGTDWYVCADGCQARWPGPEPHCVDFMSEHTTEEEKEQAA